MASKGKYHLLPEETGRPSIDTEASEDRPLISISKPSSPKGNEIGFTNFNPTFFLRLITFILHLAAVIVLGTQREHEYYYDKDNSIPSIVFLSFSLARNFYVMFHHLLSKVVEVRISLQVSGLSKGKGKAGSSSLGWLRRRLVPIVIDGTILCSLLITLPIGLKANRWGLTAMQQNGYAVALSAIPIYFLAIIDCGVPNSIAMSVQMMVVWKRYSGERDTQQIGHGDIEALLPEQVEQVQQVEAAEEASIID